MPNESMPIYDFTDLADAALVARLDEALFNVANAVPGSAVVVLLQRKVDVLEAECRRRGLDATRPEPVLMRT